MLTLGSGPPLRHLSSLEAFKEQLICKIRHRPSDSCRRDDKANYLCVN